MTIHLLPESVQNQIAAGEVVERPSSVLKELLDNAQDAGASHIEIEILSGGTELIRVTDNGAGIPADELPLATRRHATSKIKTISDIETVVTMGFRGEALASIASVSRFMIQSATDEKQIGSELVLNGSDQDPELNECRHQRGTSVFVRDLFFNIPVRREFLKSEKAELRQAIDVIKKFIIVNPKICVTYIQEGKKRWTADAAVDEASFRERMKQFMPEHFNDLAIYHEYKEDDCCIRGYLAPAELTRSQGDYQFIFVNTRPIRDPKLAFTVKRAYQDIIYGQRHSMYIVWIDLNPRHVDVNIHPRKSEVRFKSQTAVHQALYRFANQALSQKPAARIAISSNTPVNAGFNLSPTTESVVDKLEMTPAIKTAFQSFPSSAAKPSVIPVASEVKVEVPTKHEEPEAQEQPLGFAIGQLLGIYILSQTKDGLIVVDMHAAHERILLEKYKKQYSEDGIRRMNLLMPIAVKLNEHELGIFDEFASIIRHMGFGAVRQKQEVILSQVPIEIKLTAGEQVFRDLLADLAAKGSATTISKQVNEMLATICCHRAIRKMRILSLTEMNQLLRDIEQTDRSDYCNHGRPTWSLIPLSDLDRYFHRGH
tara:strand:- start:3169 stop:4965 length:1797 start_codon:yes stop_codon:yes gene_type:complete